MAAGDRDQVFRAEPGRFITLNPSIWQHTDVAFPDSQLRVEMQIVDAQTSRPIDYGTVTHQLRAPWLPRNFTMRNENFSIEWGIELLDVSRWARDREGEVFACRQTDGNTTCTTLSGTPVEIRFEIHPIYNFPSQPVTNLPVRPLPPIDLALSGAVPRAVIRGRREDQAFEEPISVAPGSPPNVIPNPSVIPILAHPTAQTAANIRCTYYSPFTMEFTEDDERLVWSATSLSGEVGFLGPARGTSVQVYGIAQGEVTLQVHLNGNILLASYRALVMPVRRVPCRFNILNGSTPQSRLLTRLENIYDHLAIVNRYLRQIAIELTFDTNPTVHNQAQPIPGHPGIFFINVGAAGLTRNIRNGSSQMIAAGMMNHRPGVMNFCYIRSSANGSFLGLQWVGPRHPRGRFITDQGTISSSWVKPSGIAPDAQAQAVQMRLMPGFPLAGHPDLFGMLVSEDCGHPVTDRDLYATTIVHEFGHALNLGHRNQPNSQENASHNDQINFPPEENIMFWADSPRAQFFDIIQASAAHESVVIANHGTISPESQT